MAGGDEANGPGDRAGRAAPRAAVPDLTGDVDAVDATEALDQLPGDLDVTAYRGPYSFPDNSRRRIPGVIHLVVAAVCLVLWATRAADGVLVNDGMLLAGGLLGAIGAFHLSAGWQLRFRETDALVAASRTVGFPVGHASAQLAWRGLRSRPTWRILLYSAEQPPLRRGLVLVDGIDGSVVAHFVEENPEDWTKLSGAAHGG